MIYPSWMCSIFERYILHQQAGACTDLFLLIIVLLSVEIYINILYIAYTKVKWHGVWLSSLFFFLSPPPLFKTVFTMVFSQSVPRY